MASITFATDNELKSRLSKFAWINFSELIRQEILRRQELLDRFNSPEEQELIKWSVELGRKSKKGRFKQLLEEVSPETRDRLLDSMSPEERQKYG